MLDSGAAFNQIDPSVVHLLRSGIQRKRNALDPELGSTVVRVAAVDIGSVRLLGQTFVETPSPFRSPQTHEPEAIAGCLGYSTLRLLTVGFDFGARRLWVWPPAQGADAREKLFGAVSRSSLLCLLKTGPLGVPTASAEFGDQTADAVVDTGAYLCALPAGMARVLSRRTASGGNRSFTRQFGLSSYRIGVLDRIRIEALRWEAPAVLMGQEGNDVEALLGITLFRPLGRVLFDFSAGAIFYGTRLERISFLDSALCLYSEYREPGVLQVKGKAIPTRWIDNVQGISVAGLNAAQPDWTQNLLQAASAFRFGLKQRTTIEYHFDGSTPRTATISSSAPEAEFQKASHGVPQTSRYQQPGFYLLYGSRALLLPPGEAWLPIGSGSVISVGGVGRVVHLDRRGKYDGYRLIPSEDGTGPYWEELGWTRPSLPALYRPDGTSVPLVDAAGGHASVPVPTGLPFAAGTWQTAFDPDSGSFRIYRQSQGMK